MRLIDVSKAFATDEQFYLEHKRYGVYLLGPS